MRRITSVRESFCALVVATIGSLSSPMIAAGDDVPLSADAFAVGSTIYGDKKMLRLKAGLSPDARTLLRFDLSTLPPGTAGNHLSKATLTMGVAKVYGAGSFDVFRVTSAWPESATNWTVTLAAAVEASANLAAADDLTFKTVDVTNLVHDWLNGTAANNGMALVPNGTLDVVFDSKENKALSHVPRLDVVLNGGRFANVAIGVEARQSGIGQNNTGVGYRALKVADGTNNTAVGTTALSTSSTGAFNTAVGSGALEDSTSGSANTAVGYAAIASNVAGGENSALGNEALLFNQGSRNTAIGSKALINATGSDNIAVGASAGIALTAGDNNVYVGNAGQLGDSGAIRIGNALTTGTFLAGVASASVSGNPVYVDSNGKLGLLPSSARFKEGVRDMGGTHDELMKLRPVRFRYAAAVDPSGVEQYGLIAEEVAHVSPHLVVYGEDGGPRTVRYDAVNGMLLNEVQQQAREIEVLTDRLARLETALAVARTAKGLKGRAAR